MIVNQQSLMRSKNFFYIPRQVMHTSRHSSKLVRAKAVAKAVYPVGEVAVHEFIATIALSHISNGSHPRNDNTYPPLMD